MAERVPAGDPVALVAFEVHGGAAVMQAGGQGWEREGGGMSESRTMRKRVINVHSV